MRGVPSVVPEDLGLSPERLQRLVDVLQSDVDRGRLPGAVALIQRRGQTALLRAVGVQNPVSGLPMSADSIFRIYSMTKPIVSVAVMMLMEQGRLLLSDPVSKYLPAFAQPRVVCEQGGELRLEATHPPTLQDLLRHTAGLTYEFLGDAWVRQQYEAVNIASRGRTNAEFTQALAALPLMHPPGTVWEYSRATDVLGRLVEVVSGQTLGAFLQQHILGPLGMVDTAFHVPADKHHRIAEPFAHDPDGGEPMKVPDPRHPAPMEGGGGGLMSTIRDYARFLQCLLNRGALDGVRLLGPHTVDFMTADHLGGLPATGTLLPAGHGFGLGFAVRTAPGLAPVPGSVGLYYWGGIAGTTFFVDPALDLLAILMIQAPNQRDHYRPLFRQLVYAALTDS